MEKVIFKLTFFNLGWLSISFVAFPVLFMN